MLTPTTADLTTLHGLYHPAPVSSLTHVPDTHTPNDGVNFLTSDDYDQISGILSDYCVLQMQQMQALRGMPGGASASDLCQKWLERAADLRDRIEAR
jgi:hypothetical protein